MSKYILNMYGSLAGIFIIALIAALIIFIFGAVIKQKNELGLSMGLGCGMLLLMNFVINILCAIGVLPPTASFLPFFSAGGSHLILCYALIGIVLSIFIDESGDWGEYEKHCPYYIVTMVMHDQSKDID